MAVRSLWCVPSMCSREKDFHIAVSGLNETARMRLNDLAGRTTGPVSPKYAKARIMDDNERPV